MSETQGFPDRASRRPGPPMRTSRRVFLQLGAGAAAAMLLQPLRGRGRALSAGPPPAVKVLVEDVTLDPPALARGSLVGLRTFASGLTLAPGRSAGRYTSQVLTATTRFTHIGVHWLADDASPDALSFELRWSAGGRGWSQWEEVAIEAHAPDAAAPRTFGALVAADRANRVQFRVAFDAATGASPLLRETTLTLLNAKDGPSIPPAAPLESATTTLELTAGARLYSRKDWGADESLRFIDGVEIWPRMYVPTKKLVVHHTVTSNNYGSAGDAILDVRAIYTYHAVTLGWGDIGYNSIIDRFGNVYEGRYGRDPDAGGREILSPDVVAGHALSHNYGATGIALLGTFTNRGEGGKPGDPPSQAMTDSLVDLLAWECERHDVDPEGASDFLRSDDGWNRGLANVPGHRDCNPTICPGGHIYDLLPELRSRVATALARGTPSVSLATPAEDTVPLSQAGALQYNWGGSTEEFSYLLEGWRRQPSSEDLDYLAGFDPERHPAWEPTTLTSATFGELFDAFGLDEQLTAGHYTLHVRAVDESDNPSYQADHTLLVTDDVGNAAPTATIAAPIDGSTFASGETILFQGAASDTEDDDLTADLVWTSDLDGQIGSGGSFTAVLSDGTHVITASATDSAGASGSDQVSVTVGGGSGDLSALTASGYKVRGRQKADLAWSGATTTNVDIYRDGTLIATVSSDENGEGAYTDHIDQRGGGSYSYQVCEAGTSICSKEASVTF